MAQLVLSTIGSALGRRFAPAALRGAASALGRAAGSALGAEIDQSLFGEARTRSVGALSDLYLSGSSAGAPIAKVYGRARVAGQIIWAARFKEAQSTEESRAGGKGGQRVRTTSYRYSLSFAVALCEGPIAGLGTVWANGAPLDLSQVAHRLHRGDPGQAPDPLIEAIEGADAAPAYRGLAYLVFEDLPLEGFGDSVPSISAEVIAPLGGADRLEARARGVCLIPGAGEFVYAPNVMRRLTPDGERVPENTHAQAERANVEAALDQLQAEMPNVTSVLIVVSWFGDDLRCGHCQLKPGVETAAKDTEPSAWQVGPVSRGSAHLVSQINGAPALGGTPDDRSVKALIAACKARGLKVGLYPFVMMDIPASNAKPDPYGGGAQAAYPWRGRITASIAPGRAGTPDKTPAAATEVAAFFGAATAAHFPIVNGAVGYTGPAEWSFRRFILHYARLAAAAGGVDSFIMGSELVGLTTLRSGPATYPAVSALRSLAQEVRTVLGATPVLTYAADWTEYAGHRPQDGSGDVFFHLDPLWADPAISVVGVDWYPPLTDWRDHSHLDGALAASPHDPAYLESRIEGGEAFDWHYASAQDRAAQIRTPITDGAYGKPWVHRAKDLRSFWSLPHYNRPGGAEAATPTAWVPQSKPIWLVELGCPAVDKGGNSPNLFIDPKSSESALPPFSSGARDDLIQRRVLEAYLSHWRPGGPANPQSSVDGRFMIAPEGVHLWCWDARPYPAFPARSDVWSDAPSWERGHWLTGRVGAADLASVIRDLCGRAAMEVETIAVTGLVAGLVLEGGQAPRAALEPLLALNGLVARTRDGVLRVEPAAGPASALEAGALVEDGAVEAIRPAPDAAPASLRLRCLDPSQDYRVQEVTAYDPAGGEGGAITLEAPLVLSSSQAQSLARQALAQARAETAAAVAVAPPGSLALEPGDLVTLPQAPAAGLYRVTRVRDAEARRLTLVPHVAAFPPTALPPTAAPTAPLAVSPSLIFVDAPLISGLTDGRPLVGVRAAGWPGAVGLWIGPDAASATRRGEATQAAVFGTLLWDLWPGPIGRFDRGNRVRLRLPGAELSAVSEAALFGGANAFAVRAPDGVWEVFQARDATLVAADEVEVSMLLRSPVGRRSEVMIPAGAPVALLDRRLTPLDLAPHEAFAPLTLFATLPGRSPAHAATTAVAIGWQEAAKTPPAPAHLRRRTLSNGDTEVSWVRCAREGGDAWGSADPPQEPEGEAYSIEVMRNAVVVRSAEVSGSLWVYPAAARAADFALGGAARVRVRQRGAGGRLGYGRESAL